MIINTYKDFLKYISENKKGVYVICGQEKNLIRKSIKNMYDLITDFPEMNLITLSGEGINADSILNSCETLPFFSDRKLIHIKSPDFLKKSKKDNSSDKVSAETNYKNDDEAIDKALYKDVSSFLNKYILNLPENIILLISYEDDVDLNNKFITSIKNIGCLIQYKLLKPKELEEAAYDMFKERGKEIKKAEIAYLTSDISSIDELEVEVDKICAYALEEKVVTKEHIDAVTSKSIESNIFKLIDAIIKKNADIAENILNSLLFQGENHLIILSMIIRQYRLIYNVKRYLLLGKNHSEIKNILKIKNDIVFKNLINQSNSTNFKNLKKAFDVCLETDFKIKSGKLSYNLALEMLIVELCK